MAETGKNPEGTDTDKNEAREIVANAQKEQAARIAAREKAKTATGDDLQALINSRVAMS